MLGTSARNPEMMSSYNRELYKADVKQAKAKIHAKPAKSLSNLVVSLVSSKLSAHAL